jgi:uncharacterized protein
MVIIDSFQHIRPPKYAETLYRKTSSKPVLDPLGRPEIEAMYDMKVRFEMMDRHAGYVQILTIALPMIEDVAGPELSPELARIANDEMAELVIRYPDRFLAAVAHLPMNNIDAAIKELERAITHLGFRGVQIASTINDKPLSSPEFEPLFEKLNDYNLPVLIHPRSTRSGPRAFFDKPSSISADKEVAYRAEKRFNWTYETSLSMGHLVYSGLMEKYPRLKVLTHHCGGIVPYQAKRILNALPSPEGIGGAPPPSHCFPREPIEYYKMMYGDTACWGNTAALMCGYSFFGSDRILFGTDFPFGHEGGVSSIRNTIRSVQEMNIPEEHKKKIFEDNARKLFRLPL